MCFPQLRDMLHNDRFGRQVTVLADGRRVAASAINTALFQLCHEFARNPRLKDSQWHYIKGEKQGPHPYSKMLKWARKGWFREDMSVQHAELRVWVPLWFLPQIDDLLNGVTEEAHAVEAMDLDELVDHIKQERATGTLRSLTSLAPGAGPLEFPELLSLRVPEEEAEPMDYEGSAAMGGLQGGARLFVVVDTNVLMSHMASTERIFGDLAAAAQLDAAVTAQGAAATGQAASPGEAGSTSSDGGSLSNGPLVEALLVIPWIVLNELDKLKHSPRLEQAESARYALTRIRQLTSARDTFMRVQTAAEHAKVMEEVPAPLAGNARQLRNDDAILQTCQFYTTHLAQRVRSAGIHSAVLLLTNDQGLCVRAEANAVKCYTAQQLPKDPQVLAQDTLDWEQQHGTGLIQAVDQQQQQQEGLGTSLQPQAAEAGGPLSPAVSGDVPPGFSPQQPPNLAPPPGLPQPAQDWQAQHEAQQAQQAAEQGAEERLRQLQLEGQQRQDHEHQQWQLQQQQQEWQRQQQLEQQQQQQQEWQRQHQQQLEQQQQLQQQQPQQNPFLATVGLLARSVGLSVDQLLAGLTALERGEEASPQIKAVVHLLTQRPELLQALQHMQVQGPQQQQQSSQDQQQHQQQQQQQAAALEAQQAAQQQRAQQQALQQHQLQAQLSGQLQDQLPRQLSGSLSGGLQGLNPNQLLALRDELLRRQHAQQAAAQQGAAAASEAAALGAQAGAAAAAQRMAAASAMMQAGSPGGGSLGRYGQLDSPSRASYAAQDDSGQLGRLGSVDSLEAMTPRAGGGYADAMQQQGQLGQQVQLQQQALQARQAQQAHQLQQAQFQQAQQAHQLQQAQQAHQMQQAKQAHHVQQAQQAQLQQAMYAMLAQQQAARMGGTSADGAGRGHAGMRGLPGAAPGETGYEGGQGGAQSPSSAPAESWDNLANSICEVVERGIGPFVKYHRQQEFGDFWTDMLADDQRPPWDAKTVMHLVEKAEFRDYLSRPTREQDVKSLQRFCYHRCRPRPPRADPAQVQAAAGALVAVAREFAGNAHKPIPNAEAPDPETIGPEFVSLGAASAALQQGVAAAQALLAICTQRISQWQPQ
ncbi:hypothetical protein N2152v2_008921 [Parachlorella kessleri]